MTNGLEHLITTPVLLPLVMAAVMLVVREKQRRLKQVLSLLTSASLIFISATLLYLTAGPSAPSPLPQVYLLGNWPAPFGIVLVVDHLSALMLVLASILGFACLVYAIARWDRSGPRFHSLFLFLLMGVNGAFLTGDLFNLFVFFEILLASSYGLALHGGGASRTTASLHYIGINVASSLLFLVGAAMIYAITGTLNLADIARLMPGVSPEDDPLLKSGMAILGIVFLVKAGTWPLGFWLPKTYGVASPPAAAVFAILTKVGVYIILRFSSLFFIEHPVFAGGAGIWLKYTGMATMTFGIVSLLASRTLTRLAGCYLIISSGTLLAAIGFGNPAVTSGLLFYLVSSTLTAGAMYLIIEPVERHAVGERVHSTLEPVFEDEFIGGPEDEEAETEIGVAIPATVALLGGGFTLVALLLAGLPPLPSFVAKFAIMDALVRQSTEVDSSTWMMIALMIISGLAALIAMTRAGIDLLWTPTNRPVVRLNIVEAWPIALLLATCVALIVFGAETMLYMEKTAQELYQPALYMDAVLTKSAIGVEAR